MSIGVVLIVKNEVFSICHWVRWHKFIGFDNIIVFDDNSNDGTSEILENLRQKNILKLEPLVGDMSDWYYERQQRCYRYAIEKYKNTCDWLAFFDSDEYLYLEDEKKISDFLSSFSEADGVAVNWCNYGSSDYVIRPDVSPIEAYTWHSNADRLVNRHVKSIIRPMQVGQNWKNVHSFDIKPDKYLLSDGSAVRWGDEDGIIDRAPNWIGAKLMHFQCRSMEDFVERARKRPELNATVALWNASDFRDIEDRRPAQMAKQMPSNLTTYVADGNSDIASLVSLTGEYEVSETTLSLPLSLDEIGLLTGTDKSSRHHGYLNFYDRFLAGLRDRPIKFLEIGVDKGFSINMWANYFGQANIVGIDINPAAREQQSTRVSIEIGDQSDTAFLRKTAEHYGQFDIIVDDGSHVWHHQLTSIKELFSYVKRDGFYIIEDLQTSFEYHDSYEHFRAGADLSTTDYLVNVAKMVVARHAPVHGDEFLEKHLGEIEFIAFQYGAALIKKRA